ncbi:MAG: hypothetical protein DMG61_04325, partial [Acidobacteria bacterium]
MKQTLLWIFASVIMSGILAAQDVPAKNVITHEGSNRMFFPHDTFWGYAQFDVAPPHNEIDPNLCRADSGMTG